MLRFGCLLVIIAFASALNLDYLQPILLQTKTSAKVQEQTAQRVISAYTSRVTVAVEPILFQDNKDSFTIRTQDDKLHIRASSGVAALWGFNYFLKKHCKSQIAWQVSNVQIPSNFPRVDEVVVANDRFRYYQNVCTASYSFAWWDSNKWLEHVAWMALNGVNLALAPVAQEAAWDKIYRSLGMTNIEIDKHFSGPAFLSWQRMGNLRGWGGPLQQSWLERQKKIQDDVISFMFNLGMIPVIPAFAGHVPKAFARLYPNASFHTTSRWGNFDDDYCCSLFLDPKEALFKEIGIMFLKEIATGTGVGHIYNADPFNEVEVTPWSDDFVRSTADAIYTSMRMVDPNAVWLLQNWMFVFNPLKWSKNTVKSFLTTVPNGRILVLDLQSEQWPQYNLYEMYFGQPFIWCMLHNFGGTLGMFGNMKTINSDVYSTRDRINGTMIGIGLTPEGINQNYVVYDLMLESAWRKEPVADMDLWLSDYAERRYGCNATGEAWSYLHKSVYSFHGLKMVTGKYAFTRRPTFQYRPWAWYSSHDLVEAWRQFVFAQSICNTHGYYHDLIDVTRQVLQYRAEQMYVNVKSSRLLSMWVFRKAVNEFMSVLEVTKRVLASNSDFTAQSWLNDAKSIGSSSNPMESKLYDFNARNQITLWGPKGEISDYACKQWAELFEYYYIPRWNAFFSAAFHAKERKEFFDEDNVRAIIRDTVETNFSSIDINALPYSNVLQVVNEAYNIYAHRSLEDLPIDILVADPDHPTTWSAVAALG